MAGLSVLSLVAWSGVASAEPGFSEPQRLPIPSGIGGSDATYSSISCPVDLSCTAVGDITWGDPWVTTLDAGAWTNPQPLLMPAGAVSGSVQLTCPSPADCLAAGSDVGADGATLPVVVTESAGTWDAAVALQPPADAVTGATADAGFGTPWCASAGNCVVVGTYAVGAQSWRLMSAVETAGTWSAVTSLPGDESGTIEAASITCDDTADCVAVAGGDSWTEALGSWGAPTSLGSTLAPYDSLHLTGIACPSATTCIAVGNVLSVPCQCRPDSSPVTVTETGGVWGLLVLIDDQVVYGGGISTFSGISCVPDQCVAVGRTFSDNDFYPYVLPIVYTWSAGAWSGADERFGPLDPDQNEASWLNGVSCSSPDGCTAVGVYGVFDSGSGPVRMFPYVAAITPVRPIVAPSPPPAVSAVVLDSGAQVLWQPSTDDGGAPITSYRATASPGAETCTTTATSCTLTGLTNGHHYLVAVTASNGTARSAGTFSKVLLPGAAPDAPAGLGVSVLEGRATVHWNVAQAKSGERILGYTVSLWRNRQVRTYWTKSTSVALGGLRGGPYVVNVRAFDANGVSRSTGARFTVGSPSSPARP